MKTQFLLISFLFLFAWSVQAQVQQRKATLPSGPERSGIWINPPQPGFKPNRMVVPAKRNMFSPSTYAWQWDTIICYTVASGSNPYQRITRTYNSMGDSVVQLMERRQGSLLWENYAREFYTYDATGNEVAYLAELWLNNTWVNYEKRESVFNSNEDPLEYKRAFWISNHWVNWWWTIYHYGTNGSYDTCTYIMGQDTAWVNSSRNIPTYLANGDMASEMVYAWTNNSWVYSQLDTMTYDANHNRLTYFGQDWVNSSWVNHYLQFNTWDLSGNLLTWKYQLWQNNTWENNFCDSSIYDPDGNKIENIQQSWSGGAWVNSHHILYVYDTSHNKLSETSQDWVNGNWRSAYREEYTYDSLGNSLTGIAGNYSYNNTWQPYDLGLSVFTDHKRDMVLEQIYRYTAVVDSVLVYTEPTRYPGEVSLFPNPAHSIVYISSPGVSKAQNRLLTMYDLRGQFVLTKQLVSEITGIDVSGLKPGVYFVRFRDNRMTRVLKIVKD